MTLEDAAQAAADREGLRLDADARLRDRVYQRSARRHDGRSELLPYRSERTGHPMRLSEAIRLGSMLHPQLFGSGERWRDSRGRFCSWATKTGHLDATCALAAARDAGYFKCRQSRRYLPLVVCPVCPPHVLNLEAMVVHLNDIHRWTREQIADWVETLEAADEPHVSPEAVAAIDPVGRTGQEGSTRGLVDFET